MTRDTWEPPETLRQAQTWETVKNRYLAAGLCVDCASQASYGHQLGFARIHPPCGDCAPIVARFPNQATTVWRRLADPSRQSPRPFPQDRRSTPRRRGSDNDAEGRQELGGQPGRAVASDPSAVPSEVAR